MASGVRATKVGHVVFHAPSPCTQTLCVFGIIGDLIEKMVSTEKPLSPLPNDPFGLSASSALVIYIQTKPECQEEF
jgi:hypothetical protein